LNSFVNDRQNYIHFLEGKLESNNTSKHYSETYNSLVDKCDLIQDKLSEQERKLNNLTKLVELNSHLEHNSINKKQELDKVEYVVDKRIAEALKLFVDRKMLENRLYEIELKIKSLSSVNTLQSTQYSTNSP